MINILAIFLTLLFISSVFCVGVYNLSRHYIEILPNGEKKVRGFILKWWSYYIEKVEYYTNEYYVKEEYNYKLNDMFYRIPRLSNIPFANFTEKDISDAEKVLLCKIEIINGRIFFYIEKPHFELPEWVQKPLSSCPTCMSSFWGSILFFTFNYAFDNVFFFGGHQYTTFFWLYITFLVLLSQFNTILHKKTVKYVL
jgi:hypothetical protein